jgi:hypothetical protein
MIDVRFDTILTSSSYFSDPPSIIVDQPWIHAGEKSTILLTCQICATKPYLVSSFTDVNIFKGDA